MLTLLSLSIPTFIFSSSRVAFYHYRSIYNSEEDLGIEVLKSGTVYRYKLNTLIPTDPSHFESLDSLILL